MLGGRVGGRGTRREATATGGGIGRSLRAGIGLWLVALLTGCGPEPAGLDLPGIRERGSLRLLRMLEPEASHLPRRGWPPDLERQHAAAFAAELGLEVEWVEVSRWEQLFPALLEGRGDLVADNVTVTPERSERLAFSAPYAVVREQVVARPEDAEEISGPEDLIGRQVAVRASSAYRDTLERLREEHGGIGIAIVPEEESVDETLEGVATGAHDLALADGNLVAQVLAYRDDLAVAFELERDVVIAWAMRPDAPKLRRAVDAYLTRVGTAQPSAGLHTDDLEGLRRRGSLRVLTRNNAATYYVQRGQLMGFEFELAREFARRQGLRLEMVVPPSRADLFTWLRDGRGDLVAAGVTATPERAEREGVVFSRPYQRVREVVVARADDPVASPQALEGRRFAVRPGSHYRRTLEKLRTEGIALEIELVPEELETEEIVAGVGEGRYELTLADEHLAAIETAWREDVRIAFPLEAEVAHGWALRPSNPQLRRAVDAFFGEEYRGTFMNVLVARYFEREERIREHAEARPQRAGRLTPWDEILRRVAGELGFDWRLIAAQMMQESRLDPEARSAAGARGLMQVLPRTAASLGIENLDDPARNIEAGVRYLAWTRDRFEDSLSSDVRRWFALAAYNVGWGHVFDARRLARRQGLDPDRWFDHVEKALLSKRRAAVADGTRFGWCRCEEPVRYVRSIRSRYRAYVQMLAAASHPLPSALAIRLDRALPNRGEP